MTRNGKNLFLYVFIIAIPVGAPTVMLIRRAARPSQTVSSSPNEATNAAFRDGLYQGKLAAEHGREPRPSSGRGRWNSDQDRASFISGYQQGYPMVSTARDAGVVSGKVTVEGQPSKPKTINMSAEPNCAKMYSTPPTSEDVIVGPGGALKNVAVYISAGAAPETAPPSQPISMMQKGCRFSPHIVAMQVNQELQVVNDDSTSHNVHPLPSVNREWNKAQLPGTPPLSETFARQEIIPVKCNIHPWMRGYFVVLKTSHYSVTGDSGAFTLNNLPPGKYTITAWHETYGTQTQEVTITGNETIPINFVFKAR